MSYAITMVVNLHLFQARSCWSRVRRPRAAARQLCCFGSLFRCTYGGRFSPHSRVDFSRGCAAQVARQNSDVCFVCSKSKIERCLPYLPSGQWVEEALTRVHMK